VKHYLVLKGLGHAILGNFSPDQMVIKLKISTTAQTIEELKQNTGKPRRGMDGQNWRGLKWIAFAMSKFENNRPTFFQICISLYQNVIFTITAEIHARSLVNFYCQYADRHMNLKFM